MKYSRFEELPVWKDAIEFGSSSVCVNNSTGIQTIL